MFDYGSERIDWKIEDLKKWQIYKLIYCQYEWCAYEFLTIDKITEDKVYYHFDSTSDPFVIVWKGRDKYLYHDDFLNEISEYDFYRDKWLGIL